ncbi:MAG: protein kinase [Acidobacteria bacterium]|nr:protein kinase [Acidobacteriota bacterium]
MTLSTGTTLSHYEITAEIGKGGMGEVYQAKDRKLGRDVAIKVLPEEFAQDDDRVARFQREAKLLASLNHPNIAAIYGLEEADGTNFLVMELVEGQTLDDRIKTGAIPVEEALKLALQIAEALEAAHEKGVIHRDLKPANIKVTPDGKVKVLDFGLAKAFAGEQPDLNLSNSPTLSVAATQQGAILGTAAYMSPEQARGKEVDKRADIWAFGVVLFEMLTGRQIFSEKTVSDTLASVLKSEPEWQSLPQNLHHRIRLLLERCLKKECKNRYSGISDARVDIQEVLADPSGVLAQPVPSGESRTKFRTMIPWLVATLVLGAVIAGIIVWKIKPIDSTKLKQVVHATYNLPKDHYFSNEYQPLLAVSPEGSQFVYCAQDGIYLRSISKDQAIIIPGTKGIAQSPFFSPDGKWIGYYSPSEKKLKKIRISGGIPTDLCIVDSNPVIPDWGADGNIVFGQFGKGIMQIPEKGGKPDLLLKVDYEYIFYPQALPNGKAVLYSQGDEVIVQELESEEPKPLFPGTSPRYLPTGHILFSSGNTLFTIPFDLNNLEITGDAIPVFNDVHQALWTLHYAVSGSGTIVYIPRDRFPVDSELVWVDMNGNEEPLGLPSADYRGVSISPTGNKIAYIISAGETSDLFIYDLAKEKPEQLTVNKVCGFPLWSPDGQRIFFSYSEDNFAKSSLCWKASDGRGDVKCIPTGSGIAFAATSWSRDGKRIVGTHVSGIGALDIGMVSVGGNGSYELLLSENYMELNPKISPNGLWMAYGSHESSLGEIIIRPFPDVKDWWKKISVGGGSTPLWSPDSSKLYYFSPDSKKMSVSIETEPDFEPQNPETLFTGVYRAFGGQDGYSWDIHPNENKFLMLRPATNAADEFYSNPRSIEIVLNWFEELKDRVPMP